MNNSTESLRIISLNVKVIVSANKCRKIFIWFKKQKADVIFMQETHCTKNKLNGFKNSWNGNSYYGLTDSAHSRGVGILFNPKLDITVHSVHYTNTGRQLLINVEIKNKLYSFINVYAPNEQSERETFFV